MSHDNSQGHPQSQWHAAEKNLESRERWAVWKERVYGILLTAALIFGAIFTHNAFANDPGRSAGTLITWAMAASIASASAALAVVFYRGARNADKDRREASDRQIALKVATAAAKALQEVRHDAATYAFMEKLISRAVMGEKER